MLYITRPVRNFLPHGAREYLSYTCFQNLRYIVELELGKFEEPAREEESHSYSLPF